MSDQLSSLELIQISKLIKDISALGLRLGFEDAEVEAFEDANKMDLPKKKGTHAMLKEWYEKDGSTKAKLIEALKQSGFGKLADRVQKGILKEDAQTNGPSTSGASASTTSEHDQPPVNLQIGDETLREIAKSIITGLDELSTELGVTFSDLKRYKATNYATGEVTAQGTTNMLFEWREKASNPRNELREALRRAQLFRIQEQYLP